MKKHGLIPRVHEDKCSKLLSRTMDKENNTVGNIIILYNILFKPRAY